MNYCYLSILKICKKTSGQIFLHVSENIDGSYYFTMIETAILYYNLFECSCCLRAERISYICIQIEMILNHLKILNKMLIFIQDKHIRSFHTNVRYHILRIKAKIFYFMFHYNCLYLLNRARSCFK